MKKFEKWWKTGTLYDLPLHNERHKEWDNFHKGCEQGWKAALEWVHKYMIEQEPTAPYFDYVLLSIIEQELQE